MFSHLIRDTEIKHKHFQNESGTFSDSEPDSNDTYKVFEENMSSSLYHFKKYLKNLIFIYVFGSDCENQYDFTVSEKVFDSFSKNSTNKVLKNLLNISIKKEYNEQCEMIEEYDMCIEKSNHKRPRRDIMVLSLRTLLEISTLPQTIDLKKESSEF